MTFLNALKTLLSGASLLTPLLALFGVALPPAAILAIPMVTKLMGIAEEAYGDGSGPLKKAAVTSFVNTAIVDTASFSTGGQAETLSKLTPDLVSTLIDTIATVSNSISKVSGGDIVFDNSQFELNKTQAGA